MTEQHQQTVGTSQLTDCLSNSGNTGRVINVISDPWALSHNLLEAAVDQVGDHLRVGL